MSHKIKSSWEDIAPWYNGWVGAKGSKYHRQLLIPHALQLLQLKPGEQFLDLGCGTAAITEYLPRNVNYIGIDASAKMVTFARQQHKGRGHYIVADATSHKNMPSNQDAALCLMAIEDMESLDGAVKSAKTALKKGGRFVIVMRHPGFNIPRQSGWELVEQQQRFSRRIDSYLMPKAVPMQAMGNRVSTRSYHRPLSEYLNACLRENLRLEEMVEIPDTINKKNQEIPLFIGLKFLKQ